MKILKLSFWGIAIILFACQCRDDEAMVDPCEGLNATSAEFYIYPNLGFAAPDNWRNIDADTIGFTQGGTFVPKYKSDKYIWLIGSEMLEDSVISRSNFPENENVTVTLIVENFNPSTECFPNDIGRDTFSRTFFANKDVAVTSWEGEFKGVYDFLPGEEHQFALHRDSFWVYGLPYNECQHRFDVIASTRVALLFKVWDVLDQNGRCGDGYQGFMAVDVDSFFIDIIRSNSNPDLNDKKMSGVKIH